MAINYGEIYRNLYQVKIGENAVNWLINDISHILKDLPFVKEHNHFYPKGLFLDNELVFYFFTESTVNGVIINGEYNNFTVKTANYTEIRGLKLEILDTDHTRLSIIPKSGPEFSFDNKMDTNKSWANRFNGELMEIYKYLYDKIK